MKTPTVLEVMASASQRATDSFDPELAGGMPPSRFPVVVSAQTRLFLEAQSEALGQSLAQLCGLILDEVAAETKRSSKARRSAKRS